MKIAIALLTAALSTAAARQHHHQHQRLHQHLHKKVAAPSPVEEVVVVPGPTVLAYVLNGQTISAQEVKEGIANGTLRLDHSDRVLSVPQPAPSPQAQEAHQGFAAPEHAPPAPSTNNESSGWSAPPAPSNEAPSSPPPAPSNEAPSSPPPSTSNSWGDDGDFDHDSSTGLDTPFPDGELDCSTFPSQYGAIPIDWMNIGGWTGIQLPGSNLGGFSDIMTVVSSQCSGGNCCSEGAYCSYACPAGYQKAQWPETQGATGQSVGGLLCQNGKLQLTNPSLSNTLCIPGASEVTVLVENNLSQGVSVCRTDYPGTEGETVPLNARPGSVSNLTCPNAANYYTWQGKSTSAQYYVNPAGVPVQTACQWGSPGNDWGNYAPLNLGVGYSNGAAWLSIFQNAPTTNAKLAFSVEITGDGISGTCKYSNGVYCGGANYDQCSSTTGCTVSLSSGTATFVFSDS